MSISRAGFARGEAIAVFPRLPSSPPASPARAVLPIAALLVLAGCASPHPAPIVHREAPPLVAAQPPVASPLPAATAADATPAAATPAADGVQTTPIARGPVETRPLPGAAGGAPGAPGAASANLLKTEPKALKQPYSDAALAQMRADAPPAAQAIAPAGQSISQAGPSTAQPIPPVASAAPSAAAIDAARPGAAAGDAAAAGWIWPAAGQVVQDFSQPSSMGISIAGKPGDPIVAVQDGRVIFSGAGPRSYGNLVIVKHGDDTLSVYAHNRALLVKEGQSVKRGQRIAELGSSGTDSPKLHFEIRKDGRPIDPRKVLPAR